MTLNQSTVYLVTTASIFTFISFSALSNKQPNEQSIDTDNLIEVITVNSDFRQQNLQQTPASLSILTSIEIKQRNAQHLEELIAISPNVNFASGSQRARYYQIRGIGERSQFQEPINPSVGVIIDGIDFTGIGSIASLFDVKQTEIYRGPQGTRFGANAIAGMINITTNDATDNTEGKLQLDLGNYHSYGLGVALSAPLNNKVNYRFAANQHKSDGFIENTYLKRNDTNNQDETSIRGKLSIEATNELTIDLTAFYFDFNNGYDAFSLDNTRETLSDQPGFDQQKTTALGVKLTYQGFEKFTLITLASSTNSDLAYGYDEDWAYVGISAPETIENQDFAYWEYSSTDYYFRNKSTQTIEFRALSNESSALFNNSTSWVAGIYFKQDNEDLQRQYTYLDADFTSTFDTQSLALYGQLDSQLNNQWSLTTGLRVEQRSADYINASGFVDKPTDTMIGGKLVLSYQQNNNSFWYGSINRGYKAGGTNTDGSLPGNLRTFEAEYLVNYELGYKVSLFDNAAFVRTSVFYMDRKDVQVRSSKTIVREDGSAEFISYLGNAATGSNFGIEIETSWQINNVLNIIGSLGLLESEFNHFINTQGVSISGRDQAHAPNYQYNLGFNIQPTEHWLMNVSIDGKDSFYFSDSHNEKSTSITLLNASITYLRENWQIKLWARNLTNEDYANRGFYFGNDPRDGYTAKQYTQLSEPLVFGVTVDYQF